MSRNSLTVSGHCFFFFLPVIQSVSNVHVVGKLLPQGSLQLALSLDGLQGLTELTLSDFLQADGILQLAVEKLGVLLQPPDLVFQTLKFHLGNGGKGKPVMSFGFKEKIKASRRSSDGN